MIQVIQADYQNKVHRAAILELINLYACDDMGQNEPLDAEIKSRLLDDLSARPWVHIFLAHENEEMIGIAVGIEGFSTFNSAPLINIHDVYVKSNFRRRGIASALFESIEATARQLRCCKLTLEVLDGNYPAQKAYRKMGFVPYTVNDIAEVAQFWQKHLQ